MSDLISRQQPVARDTDVLSNDAISRQSAIDALCKRCDLAADEDEPCTEKCNDIKILEMLPSAQPTLYGYDIKHLMLIAEVLRKENLPPERVTEALMDIGRIVSIVSDELEESLREAMKQCKI